ncbi:MAG: DUF362 domain-containing protein [Candidatus Nanoarchaeia archaeon]
MSKVYFKKVKYSDTDKVNAAVLELLKKIVEDEKLILDKKIALKVHFGEKGNETFISPKNFDSLINYLGSKKVEASFIETNALYRGERMTRDAHIALAREHGFTQLPIIIADGEHGENSVDVDINMKYFARCRIGREFSNYSQFIVLSHFKGHILAGFGGAIKQLAMGFAARGGKLDQHANSVPTLNPLKCVKCMTCTKHCPVDALDIGVIPRIRKNKCIGCATCIAVCPHKAIGINWLSTLPKTFKEKMCEYAFAAQKGKKNIYINFALNIAKGCDCDGSKMKPIAKDLGVFISLDPVAIDSACMDLVDESEGKKVFKGRSILDYAEQIGLGRKEYQLIEL